MMFQDAFPLSATVTASDAYRAIRANIPVMKAWEEADPRRDEILAYTLFNGMRIARKKNGQIRTDAPRDMSIYIIPSWTGGRIYDHVRTIDVSGLCRISEEDIDIFLRTGKLPGSGTSSSYEQLRTELQRHNGTELWDSRKADFMGSAGQKIAARFQEHQTASLHNRLEYHMTGSRRGKMGIHRQIVHIMWNRLLDREKATAAMRAYGRKCTVANYNRIVAAWNISCGPDGARNRGISALRETHRAAFMLHASVPTGIPGSKIADRIQNVPAGLKEITGDSRLWRTVRGWTDPQLHSVSRLLSRTYMPDTPAEMAVEVPLGRELLRLIAERAIWPANALTHLSWLEERELRALLPFLHVLHSAVLAARRQRRLRAFLSSIGLVTDMLVHLDEEEYAVLARDARNATWNRLNERQDAWHRRMVEIRHAEMNAEAGVAHQPLLEWDEDAQWSPILGRYESTEGEACEIADKQGLHREAFEMDHCVDGYTAACMSGVSRIFSLRSGEHRSTLEIRRRYGVWNVIQNYAVGNTLVPPCLDSLGRKVAREVNRQARARQP